MNKLLEVNELIFNDFPEPDDTDSFEEYKDFILKCLSSKENKYFLHSECHHILPVCLGGIDEGNRIYLTYKEHYFAHYYLAKAYYMNYNLCFTINMMSSLGKYNSVEECAEKYSESRMLYINNLRVKLVSDNPMWKQEVKDKISLKASQRMNTPEMKEWFIENNPMNSEHSKDLVRKSKEGRVWVNNGVEMKHIHLDELDSYLSKGYIRGMIKTKSKVSKDYDCICKYCGKTYKGGKYSRCCSECHSKLRHDIIINN